MLETLVHWFHLDLISFERWRAAGCYTCMAQSQSASLVFLIMFMLLCLSYICTLCAFQLLTNHYEQNWKYYCLPSGWGSYGTASEDELLLTKKLFWGIFDSLSQRVSSNSLLDLWLFPE